jgi:hypothetical protein
MESLQQVPGPPAGIPGHGSTLSWRRRSVRQIDGHPEGGYTDIWEIVCPDCGDDGARSYAELPPELQQVRGQYPDEDTAEQAVMKHIGLSSG